MGVQERFDVGGLHRCPVGHGSLGDEEGGEVPNGPEGAFDRRVRADVSADASGPFLGVHEVVAEPGNRRPQHLRGGIDASLPAAGREPHGLVEAEGEVVVNEEVFERPSQRSRRSARKARSFQQRLRMTRLPVTQ